MSFKISMYSVGSESPGYNIVASDRCMFQSLRLYQVYGRQSFYYGQDFYYVQGLNLLHLGSLLHLGTFITFETSTGFLDPEKVRGTQRRFPPKYTFQAIQSIFRSQEMHSKRRYKICIFSVILGELESFRNCRGFSLILPKILDAIQRFTKVRIFLMPLSITFWNWKIFSFLFTENHRWVLLKSALFL